VARPRNAADDNNDDDRLGWTRHVARVVEGEAGDLDYRCACLLAGLVSIERDDG
jgi:hypothetical protein